MLNTHEQKMIGNIMRQVQQTEQWMPFYKQMTFSIINVAPSYKVAYGVSFVIGIIISQLMGFDTTSIDTDSMTDFMFNM